jgi:hypothetical protein
VGGSQALNVAVNAGARQRAILCPPMSCSRQQLTVVCPLFGSLALNLFLRRHTHHSAAGLIHQMGVGTCSLDA